MVDAALNVAAEQVIEHSAYGSLLQRDGNRGPTAAPQNLYRTANSTRSADPTTGWRSRWPPTSSGRTWSLRSATRSGRPTSWRRTPDDGDTTTRSTSSWRAGARTRTGDEIVESLWDAGVPVAKVMQPHESATCRSCVHRGFFEQVDHPVNGTARHSTLPMRFSTGPQRFHRTPAPLLGEHNDEVLSALGLGDDEIDELEDQGVIGTAPAGLGIRTTKTG